MSGSLVSGVRWLAAQPPLDGMLAGVASSSYVREAALFVGLKTVTPEYVLSAMMAFFIVFFIFLLLLRSENASEKMRLAVWGVRYFCWSRDKRPNKPNDDKIDKNTAKSVKIIFIRHGESEWNAVFNKGSKLLLPVRLVKALINEALMLFDQDSLFIDSPLSSIGIQQGLDLLTAFESKGAERPLDADQTTAEAQKRASLKVEELRPEEIVSIIRGDIGESVVVSSILRRAISTGLLCLSPRLLKSSDPKHKILLMTSLQEISRNVDTLALTSENKLPVVPIAESKLKHLGDIISHFYKTRLDKKLNLGNKTLKMRADQRQTEFTKWVFDQKELTSGGCVIVCGHSLWFREFFKSYLPRASRHEAKSTKMVNCGCVAFDLYKENSSSSAAPKYRIFPESIKKVHGGFEQKGGGKQKTA